MSERHKKWTPVSPGTVIPAGQPTAVAFTDSKPGKTVWMENSGATHDITVYAGAEWFIDSSWKPPLDLPTEPTWGIAVSHHGWQMGQWALIGDEFWRRDIDPAYSRRAHNITDFIPLTDEQVARIEQAR